MKSIYRLLSALLLAALAMPVFAQTASATSTETPAPAASNSSQDSQVVELSPFQVSTDKDVGYRSVFSNSGNLFSESLDNLPESISVLNAQLIKDVGAVNLFQISKYATGADYGRNPYNNAMWFRGIISSWWTRNGFIWYLPMDAFSIERVEVIRGPNALLYGDAQPGGLMNVITKHAMLDKNAASVSTMIGSWARYRITTDINRVLIPGKLAARVNLAYSKSKFWQDFRHDDFRGAQTSFSYRPFTNTLIRVESEVGEVRRNYGQLMPQDYYSAYTNSGGTAGTINAGNTWNWVNGALYHYLPNNSKVSTGTAIIDPSGIEPKSWNLTGPSNYQNRNYTQWAVTADQKVAKNLNLEFAVNQQNQQNNNLSSPTGPVIYVDPNPLLPDQTTNPEYNQPYTDINWNMLNASNHVTEAKLIAVWDLDFRHVPILKVLGMQQRVLAFVSDRIDHFHAQQYFDRLINANGAASLATPFYRRIYFNQYSAANLAYAPEFDATGQIDRMFGTGFWADTKNRLFATSIAGLGSYWNGRIRTMVGVRRDRWTPHSYGVLSRPTGQGNIKENYGFNYTDTVGTITKRNSLNYGIVGHMLDDWHGVTFSSYANYSESFQPNTPVVLLNGQVGPPIQGKGKEFGGRFQFFHGKVTLNVARYNIKNQNSPLVVPQNVRDQINAIFYTNPDGSLKPGSLVPLTNAGSADTSTLNSQGTEYELTWNPSPAFTLMVNYSYNNLKQTNIYPQLVPYWNKIIAMGLPISQYVALDNLVRPALTNSNRVPPALDGMANSYATYRFQHGRLKGLFLGLGFNYRSAAYLGIVYNRAVTPNTSYFYYSKPSTIWNGSAGYSGVWHNHRYSVQLNVMNLLNKNYWVGYQIGGAQWGSPMEFRLSTTFNF